MYCYYTGVTGVLAMSLSMFTSMNVISGFGAEFPYLFVYRTRFNCEGMVSLGRFLSVNKI